MKSNRYNDLAIRCLCAVFFFALVVSCAKAEPKKTVSAPAPAGDTPVPAVSPEFASAKFRDPSAPVEERVEDLLSRMTVDEKIGQMTQVVFYKLRDGEMKTLSLGSALSGGGGSPWGNNTIAAWCDMVDGLQKEALSTRLGIPMLYGTDSVHGHNNLANATIFPHNIGIGAAGDPDLAERIGKAAALETAATGVPWTFAPCVAVARDPRWGRFYESYGQDSALVTRLSSAFIRGFQSADTGAAKPIVTAKHFLGDGNTVWGSSRTGNYFIDQGNMIKDEKFIRETLLPPYAEAVKSGARTVMTSFSSWKGVKMHAQKYLMTEVLKRELGFTGFIVSDWGGMDQIDPDYYTAIVTGINAGIDMNMVPEQGARFVATMKSAIEKKAIPMRRVDDAVRRILRVKFEMGLFERPMANRKLASFVRCPEHLALAREAARKSQVVLVNNAALPIASGNVYVAGSAADDIGKQCGGWTMTWQGEPGKITAGTSILDGIREVAGKGRVKYVASGKFAAGDPSGTCVIVTGETPYAEGVGDSPKIEIDPSDAALVADARGKFAKVVLVVVSGRPLILGDLAGKVDGLVAAWLPGTEGAGVADILFGKSSPTGKLSFAWPVSVDQLPLDRAISGEQKPLWPAGFGLTY